MPQLPQLNSANVMILWGPAILCGGGGGRGHSTRQFDIIMDGDWTPQTVLNLPLTFLCCNNLCPFTHHCTVLNGTHWRWPVMAKTKSVPGKADTNRPPKCRWQVTWVNDIHSPYSYHSIFSGHGYHLHHQLCGITSPKNRDKVISRAQCPLANCIMIFAGMYGSPADEKQSI